MTKENKQILVVALLVLLAASLRVFSATMHLYHLVPVAAIGIFSGSVLQNKKWAYLIPLSAMLAGDVFFALFTRTPGFYGISQVVNYSALALITWMGTGMKKKSVANILGFSVGGSLLYFMLSNFGTWLGGYYTMDLNGLVKCYVMAIPFYKYEGATTFFVNSLLGDLIFSMTALALYQWYERKSVAVAA